ncbi:hypothetical protein L4D76_23070 [Photobacterium sagamiensis]|uniref:hypothetical protein n=1 Tax=Photobacterium sagamiensis TaxID=2910241 RepID=UPI003D0D1A64
MTMMSSNVSKKKAVDFQFQSFQGCDEQYLLSLFNEQKATKEEQDAAYYLVFEQNVPCFHSLKKQRIQLDDENRFPIKEIATDSAVAEIEVDFPLAFYRSCQRTEIFDLLLSLKEQCSHYTFNLRLNLDDIASNYEVNDIAKLCIVAGADNLTLAVDGKLTEQEESYIILISNLLKSLFVADSCGLIYAGLTAPKEMDKLVALSKEVLGEAWVANKQLRFAY